MTMITQHKFNESVENYVASIVVDEEYTITKNSMTKECTDFELLIDMLECKRSSKDYDWNSDGFIPELASIIHSEASDWAGTMFQTRDFVEVKLEGTEPGNKERCVAAKKLINETLNRRALYHYSKYIRARKINALFGQAYAVCWWNQRVVPKLMGYQNITVPLDVDIYGNPMEDPQFQIPATREEPQEQWGERILEDCFDYEVIDPRNVFAPNTYNYSLQTKPWVIIRAERSYEELVEEAERCGYFNLDIVKELSKPSETDTSKESFNKDDQKPSLPKTPRQPLDIITRFGKMWTSNIQHDESGFVTSCDPGFDESGNKLDDAELIECVVAFALSGSSNVLIGFRPQICRDGRGLPYRPIIRGWCYIHPTKDSGLSDGRNMQELQKIINDTFNMAADRTKLATLPTLKGRKYALEDNKTIFFEPEHVMELENPETDIVEFKIADDVSGAMNQIAMLRDAMYQVTARFPTTMGALPSEASTTATAVAGSEVRTNSRTNYKSLTFEYTFLLDFYWMILQHTAQFAKPETLYALMGDDWVNFDPDQDYKYSPLSSNIEMEYNKYRKLQVIDQMLGRVVNVPNPNTPKVMNYLLKLAFELLGSEFPDYKDYMLDDSPQAAQAQMMAGKGGNGMLPAMNAAPASNQAGLPQGNLEQFARGAM